MQSSVLAADALIEGVVSEYDFTPPIRCRLVSSSLNDVYRVDTGNGRYYLRVGPRGWRRREHVEAEVTLLDNLAAAGLPVARALRRSDGTATTRINAPEGERVAGIFAEAPGVGIRDIARDHARAMGRLAAHLHEMADGAAHPDGLVHLDEQHLLDEPLAAIRAGAEGVEEDLAYLETVAERVRKRLARLPRIAPTYGICHGDLHPANVRFDADGCPTLFDFDCCGYGWRAYDLAVFFWNAYGERRPKAWRESRWRAFLAGYREVRSLESDILEAVPLFIVARQIWLAGLDYAGITNWLPQWLTPESFRETVDAVRGWVAEYPILGG